MKFRIIYVATGPTQFWIVQKRGNILGIPYWYTMGYDEPSKDQTTGSSNVYWEHMFDSLEKAEEFVKTQLIYPPTRRVIKVY